MPEKTFGYKTCAILYYAVASFFTQYVNKVRNGANG